MTNIGHDADAPRPQAFYFGPDGRRLFGCLRAPAGEPIGAVLVCPPVGHEYIRFHRALRRLAERLVACGFATLRFDLSGCGDSDGDLGVAELSQWVQDVTAALAELRARTAAADTRIVGMRLGGALALHAAAADGAIRRVALWDPVVNGRAYWSGERRAHWQMVRCSHVVSRPSNDGDNRAGEEAMGFWWPRRLVEQIRSLDLATIDQCPADHVLIVETRGGDESGLLAARLKGLGVGLTEQIVAAPQLWGWEDNLDKVHIPHRVVEAIATWMQDRSVPA